LCQKVHIEEDPEATQDPVRPSHHQALHVQYQNNLDQGDRLFITLHWKTTQKSQGTQTISQRFTEAAEATHMTHFEDYIVQPIPRVQKTSLLKSPLMNSQIRRNGTMPSELVPDAHKFRTKVNPWRPVNEKQLDEFLEENLNRQ